MEQDIKDLSQFLGSRHTSSRSSFGITRTKRLSGILHCIHDYERVSITPVVVVGTTQDDIRDELTSALQRANARVSVAKQTKATQEVEDPGELKSDKGYYEWEYRWENYLSIIPG